MTETPAPAVGQIWQDADPRMPDRCLRIASIDATHAEVERMAITPQGIVPVPGARRTRIDLYRFRPTSTGYRYVGDAT
ncbi:hypothetical protein ACH4GK_32015 [Streptomyces rimosus]|uniref:hypothetical protein n=1 Tax=Streptomyces rimosus TaxID=1927 RepID=UPI0004C8F353|nr:hypothetical protein [Streptomyces rimosus]